MNREKIGYALEAVLSVDPTDAPKPSPLAIGSALAGPLLRSAMIETIIAQINLDRVDGGAAISDSAVRNHAREVVDLFLKVMEVKGWLK